MENFNLPVMFREHTAYRTFCVRKGTIGTFTRFVFKNDLLDPSRKVGLIWVELPDRAVIVHCGEVEPYKW